MCIINNSVEPVKESHVISANNKGIYLDSKLSAEILLNSYSSYFECFAILRPFFIYSPDQDKTMLIPRLIENVINKKEIILSSINGIRINPIYIDDATKNSLKSIEFVRELYF